MYSFYKQLVALRHNSPVVAAGDWRLIDAADPHVYAFTRELDAEKLLVVVNMSSRTVDLPREAAELTAVGIAEPNVVSARMTPAHRGLLANRELDRGRQPSSSCIECLSRSKRYFRGYRNAICLERGTVTSKPRV